MGFTMKKLFLLMLAACLSVPTTAQERFEVGKPGNDAYRYLDEYQALKAYIDYAKYPNFRLGIGTTVSDYLNNSLVRNLTEKNFTETVAGNAMKMASCVDANGNMDFTTVKNYVNTATQAGLSVYGHTLAWHSQQPIGWLRKLIADRPTGGEEQWAQVYEKDFRTSQYVGWTSSKSDYGYTITFDNSNGLKIHTTKMCTNFWDVQFQAATDILTTAGKTYKMTITVRGSKAGKLYSKLGDWNGGATANIAFTTAWQDVEVSYVSQMDNNFLLLQCGDFVGDIYIRSIKFEGYVAPAVPLTQQERHDTLVYAMDKWIKGMMEACDGKVKAWDVVNEAISGDGNDGEGNYTLQHSNSYNANGTWDVGGDAFYWQDHLGDLDYVRQACRLARKYGPDGVVLFINDYNLESDWDQNKKLKSLINWIRKWESDGVTKIDGIGTQMHISYYENSGTQASKQNAITNMFRLMASSGKLVRVSELDMGYVNAAGADVPTASMTEAQHQQMADFYEWIIKEYFRLIPASQQWGVCQWCPTDAPSNSGWRANMPVGIWDPNYYRKHVYAGFVRGLGGVANGIEDVANDRSVGTPTGIYDLQGRRVTLHPSSVTRHPSPVIVNGKKVVLPGSRP